MNRRSLLTTLGPGILGFAGCIDSPGVVGNGTTEPPDDPFDTVECPTVERGVEYTVCTTDESPEGEPVYLTRSTDRADLPTASIHFTITNASDRKFNTNFWEWHLWKHVDGE